MADSGPDPETFVWDPLDEDFLRRLDTQKYVCLSRERRLRDHASEAQPGSAVQDGSKGVTYQTAISTQEDSSMNDDEEGYDDDDDNSRQWRSLFTVGMPGIMTVEELLETVDLDNIPIKSGRHLSEAQVSRLEAYSLTQ